MNPGASPWSPRQQRWLQALGHVVYRVGGADHAGPDAGGETASPAAPDVPPRASQRPAMAGAGPARVAPAAPVPAPEAAIAVPARPAARRTARLPDRLQLALLRASGLDPSDPATQAQMQSWPVEELRGDPAAKRAFWPRLRALRRRP